VAVKERILSGLDAKQQEVECARRAAADCRIARSVPAGRAGAVVSESGSAEAGVMFTAVPKQRA